MQEGGQHCRNVMPRTGSHTEVRPKCRKDSAVCAVPTYFLTRETIGNMAAMLLLIVIAMPFFLFAMYEKNGLPFEKIAKAVIKSRFLRPKVRPYKTENVYEYAEKQYDLEKEVKTIINEDR